MLNSSAAAPATDALLFFDEELRLVAGKRLNTANVSNTTADIAFIPAAVPHRRCRTSGPDVGKRWHSRLVATAEEDGLNIKGNL
jgi:hypothetical protein